MMIDATCACSMFHSANGRTKYHAFNNKRLYVLMLKKGNLLNYITKEQSTLINILFHTHNVTLVCLLLYKVVVSKHPL